MTGYKLVAHFRPLRQICYFLTRCDEVLRMSHPLLVALTLSSLFLVISCSSREKPQTRLAR
jgi:hypothetical protein